MALRLILAIGSSLLLVWIMPILNKPRENKDPKMVAYKLKSFTPKEIKKIEEIPEPEPIKQLERIPEIPQEPISQKLNTSIAPPKPNIEMNMTFTSSNISQYPIAMESKPPTLAPNANNEKSAMLIFAPKPITPRQAKQLGLTGNANIRFTVNTKGNTEKIEVLSASHSIFKRPAINAIRKFKFKPALDENGMPVKTVRTQDFVFEFEN